MGYCYAINNPNCCYIKYKNTALGQSSDWNSVIFTIASITGAISKNLVEESKVNPVI